MKKYPIPSPFRQWKLLLSLIILVCSLYAFLYYYASGQQISINNRVGGEREGEISNRKLTVVINTYNKHEMMQGKFHLLSIDPLRMVTNHF